MQFEVGAIVEGKVTGITKFGAFIELAPGKTGMVHISEVSSSYVKEISDHISESQVVKVKVLSISPEGKISLSIKKCLENQAPAVSEGGQHDHPVRRPPSKRPYGQKDMGWRGFKPTPSAENMSFEDMLSKFKQTSEDKMSDLKRNVDMRRGSSRRGGGPK